MMHTTSYTTYFPTPYSVLSESCVISQTFGSYFIKLIFDFCIYALFLLDRSDVENLQHCKLQAILGKNTHERPLNI